MAVADFSNIQAGDGIIYLNNDETTSTLALVVDPGLKKAAVAVMEPLPGGLVIVHGVDRSRIQSAFRPVRKASDKVF